MKKIMVLSVVALLAVAIVSGAAQATLYDSNLLGVYKANKVVISDPKRDDGIAALVTSEGKNNVAFDREAKNGGTNINGQRLPASVPEPATMILLGMGLIGISIYARRRFKT